MNRLGETIYFYDEKDRERPATITKIVGKLANSRGEGIFTYTAKLKGQVKGFKHGIIEFVEDKHGVRILPNRFWNNVDAELDQWGIAFRQVLPIRKGTIVRIENWDRTIQCKVLGLQKPDRLFNHLQFVFEGIRVTDKKPYQGDIGRIKGHCFTASVDSVKSVKNGTGTGKRLLVFGPYLTKKEENEIFERD